MGRYLDGKNRPGDKLSHKLFNEIRRQHRRNRIVVAGGRQLQRAGGMAVHVATETSGVRRCRNTSGDVISAISGSTPGSGEVTFYTWDGTDKTLGTETADALNDGPTDVPTGAEMFVYYEFGEPWVLGWWCE